MIGRIFDTIKDGQSTLSDFSTRFAMTFCTSSSKASGNSAEGDMREYHGITKCCTTRPTKVETAEFTWEEKVDRGDLAGDFVGDSKGTVFKRSR